MGQPALKVDSCSLVSQATLAHVVVIHHAAMQSLGLYAGRLLVEVFEDRIPLAARQLLNRCRAGSDGCFQGSTVPKLLPHLGVFISGTRYNCCMSLQAQYGCCALQFPG